MNAPRFLFPQTGPLPIPLLLVLAWTSLSAFGAERPFAEDPAWKFTLQEGELCQLAGSQPLLIFVYRDYNSEVEAFEKDLSRWTEIPELLPSYCKVALNVQDNREFLSKAGVRSAPCLVAFSEDVLSPLEDRVVGYHLEIGEREALVQFLRESLLTTTLSLFSEAEAEALAAGPAPTSASEFFEAAMDAREGGDPVSALQYLREAADRIDSTTSELGRKTVLELADLLYSLGSLEEALAAYQKADDALDSATGDETVTFHVRYRVVMLLNDVGQNEEALEYLESCQTVAPTEEAEHLSEVGEMIRAGYFVLADQGYPGVGGMETLAGGGSPVTEEKQDRGDPKLSYEQRLERANSDLDRIAGMLKKSFEVTGEYPDYLDNLPALDPQAEDFPTDPFFHESPYRYLHFENPEEYVLYSVGPDGNDQWGEMEFDPAQGEEGEGDILRRPALQEE
jgi:tetratricopeptide (TPR) repeat protein